MHLYTRFGAVNQLISCSLFLLVCIFLLHKFDLMVTPRREKRLTLNGADQILWPPYTSWPSSMEYDTSLSNQDFFFPNSRTIVHDFEIAKQYMKKVTENLVKTAHRKDTDSQLHPATLQYIECTRAFQWFGNGSTHSAALLIISE